jgi:membrane protein DedA with SNARE-associated domain
MSHIVSHLPAVITTIEPFVHQYGYIGVGSLLLLESVGLPIPGEATLISAAVFAGLGELNIFGIIGVGLIACVLGSSLGYLIGSLVGRKIVDKFGKFVFLNPKKYLKVEAFFNKRGPIVIIFARFFEVLRQLYGFITGTSSMSWWLFSVFNIIGSLLWLSFWSLIGYYGGNHISLFLKYEVYISVALGIFVVLWLIRYLLIKRKNQNA